MSLILEEDSPHTFPPADGDPSAHLRNMASMIKERKCEFIQFNGQTPRGNIFTFENCVGHMEFSEGTVADIRPKFNADFEGDPAENLMIMLYRIFGIEITATSKTENMFEFFVRVFTSEVSLLMRKGLRSAYIRQQGNEAVVKGRILFAENIRENLVHKERVFCEYEIFTTNRPENRLIKKTIEILLKRTRDNNNKKALKMLLMDLEEIPSSDDISNDFAAVILDRNMMDYTSPMTWCNLFLNSMGLAGGTGSMSSYALLMNSDKVFEAYVAKSSLSNRKDGSYSLRYKSWVETNGVSSGEAVIVVEPAWSFYDRNNDRIITDAEYLFMTTPGYAVIPPVRDEKGRRVSRIRSMAQHYLGIEEENI